MNEAQEESEQFFQSPSLIGKWRHSQFSGHTEPPSCSGELTPRAVTQGGPVHLSSHLLCAWRQALCSMPLIAFDLMRAWEEHSLSPTSYPRMRGSCWPRGLSKSAVELGLDSSCLTPAAVDGMPSLQMGSWVWRAVSFPLVKA